MSEELEAERRRNSILEEEVRRLKEEFVRFGVDAEREEERVTNLLLQRLNQIKQEKESLAHQVEVEEEFLTNTLQKKLLQLRQEKVDLENKLEIEQEYVVNRLQKQLDQVQLEKEQLELVIANESFNNNNSSSISASIASIASSSPILRSSPHNYNNNYNNNNNNNNINTGSVNAITGRITLENELEQEQEYVVNRLQKQLFNLKQLNHKNEKKIYKKMKDILLNLDLKLTQLQAESDGNLDYVVQHMQKEFGILQEQLRQISSKETMLNDIEAKCLSSEVLHEQLHGPLGVDTRNPYLRRGTL